jgi:diguanylate cyclase (GGDEF)-like protein
MSALSKQASALAQIGLVAAAYFLAARLSLALAIPPGYATAVWPPSGIALAAVLLAGARIWPGVWLGAALANFAIESSLASAVLIASGNTLEAMVAAALIRRHAGDPGSFARGEDVVRFVALCGLSATIAASVAIAALALRHSLAWSEALRNWWTWWQGDATGMIIVAPLILSWAARGAAPWPARKKLEAAGFGLLLVGAAVAIFLGGAPHFAPFSLTFVTLPFILWAAFRFGQREVASAIAVACAAAVWYVLERPAPFAAMPLNELLLMLLAFICLVVTTGLALAAVVAEGRAATEALRERHAYLSHFDPVSGLPNAVLFREHLARLLDAAGRSGRKVVVAMMDVERFNTLNDTYGREAGDALLRQIGERLAREQSGGGLVARVSGGRFAIALPGADGVAPGAVEHALVRWFGAPFSVGEVEIAVAARIGLAVFPGDGAQPDALLTNAEAALKKAKAAGERWLAYAPEMARRVAERMTLETKLRRALERQEFALHYQPKIELDTRRVAGLEALLRWRHPERGLVAPMEFIPVLEETGMILEVGRWALRRALLDQKQWAAEGVRVPRVAVNVSSLELRQRDFVETVREAIGQDAPLIDLEVTETWIMDDVESSIDKLGRLRRLGIGVAIDDFGTGYSSLAYLAKLPVETLKIDRSFIHRMLEDEETMALVQAIISLARAMKLKTVAEGVETEEQADVLELLRCDQLQGYFFCRPQPREQLSAMLRQE